jgi:hypothetical protein
LRIRALAVVTLIAVYASWASAGMTSVTFASDFSQHHLAHFDGTALYDSDTGTLTIAVQNTTSPGTGGFLSSLALAASGPTASLTVDSSRFIDARNHKGIVKAGALGKYHAGAITGPSWNSGKHAVDGIAAGGSHIFEFEVTAANAITLNVASFLTPGKSGQEIVANFKKLDHHGSDRVGAVQTSPVSEVLASQFDPVSEVGLLPIDDIAPVGGPAVDAPVAVSSVPLPTAAWMFAPTLALAALLRGKLRLMCA